MRIRNLLREPLVHFLLVGAALFAWYQWRGGGTGPGSTRIVLTSGQIEHLAAGFAKTWQRPASEAELKGLIDDWVKEEIAVREAMAIGLDRDDTVIRRRLRQKLEFLVEDLAAAAPPSDAELETWREAHPGQFATETQLALRQVFVSRDRRGAAAEADARAILARLAAAVAPRACGHRNVDRGGSETGRDEPGVSRPGGPQGAFAPDAQSRRLRQNFDRRFAQILFDPDERRWSLEIVLGPIDGDADRPSLTQAIVTEEAEARDVVGRLAVGHHQCAPEADVESTGLRETGSR